MRKVMLEWAFVLFKKLFPTVNLVTDGNAHFQKKEPFVDVL